MLVAGEVVAWMLAVKIIEGANHRSDAFSPIIARATSADGRTGVFLRPPERPGSAEP